MFLSSSPSPLTTPLPRPLSYPLPRQSSSTSDFGSICLLLLLYTLQGVPMGLHGSVPLILAKKVGCEENQELPYSNT